MAHHHLNAATPFAAAAAAAPSGHYHYYCKSDPAGRISRLGSPGPACAGIDRRRRRPSSDRYRSSAARLSPAFDTELAEPRVRVSAARTHSLAHSPGPDKSRPRSTATVVVTRGRVEEKSRRGSRWHRSARNSLALLSDPGSSCTCHCGCCMLCTGQCSKHCSAVNNPYLQNPI